MQPKYPLSFDGAPHGLEFLYQGKTRETWGLPNWPFLLLMTMSRRLSTHNVVHKSLIPLKDQVLTALTIFWFTSVLKDLPNHLFAYGKKIYDYLPPGEYPADLHLRALIVRNLRITMIEFIWRAYLTGSLWKKHYSKGLDPYGLNLPKGLALMHRFDVPIFTPTEKSETDDPIASVGTTMALPRAVRITRLAYAKARKFANPRGVDVIDTKVEVGRWLPDDPDRIMENGRLQLMLADEVLTPDSSRFALLSDIREGVDPPWHDKQISRDAAEAMWGDRAEHPPLEFSPLIVRRQTEAIMGLFELMVGMPLSEFQRLYMK